MGKYQSRSRGPELPRRDTVNPVMRGIGCLFMVIVPIFSYMVGAMLSERNFGAGILPKEWFAYMEFPELFHSMSGLNVIATYLGSIQRLPATLALGLIVLVVVGGVLSIVFGYMYSIMAPSRYGPFDVPPPRVKTKKYKR